MVVYYEPLHLKSRTLFLEQLKPLFSSLYNLINLQLIPGGKAVFVPGHGIVCPGGADQCATMKLQACVLDYFWNDGNNFTDPIRQQVFDHLWCVSKNKRMIQDPVDLAAQCSDEYLQGDAWFTIHGCFIDGTGDNILREYVQDTQSTIADVEHKSIPIVFINGVQVVDLSTMKQQVCSLYVSVLRFIFGLIMTGRLLMPTICSF